MRTPLLNPLVVLLIALLAGCATPTPPHIELDRAEHFDVPAREILISDFIVAPADNYSAYSNGFFTLGANSTDPPFSELVLLSLKTRLLAGGDANKELLEIAVLGADFLIEMKTADSIVFIGIASVLSERRHMCRVDANFRYGNKSIRQAFEKIQVVRRSWVDLPADEQIAVIEECLSDLTREIADFSTTLVSK